MTVMLHIGVESLGWTVQQYAQALDLLSSSGIDGCFVKVYEITQGEWISDADWQLLDAAFKAIGKVAIPYGFFYGGAGLVTEANVALHWLNTVGKFMIDAESGFDAQAGEAQQLASILSKHTGELYVSTWANPGDHGWLQNITYLNGVTQYWCPQIYSDDLMLRFQAQFPPVTGKIIPIVSVTGDGDPNHPDIIIQNGGFHDVQIWELQTALQQPSVVTAMFQATGTTPERKSNMIVNHDGTILSLLAGSQFEASETEFACGFFAGAVLKYAQIPQVVNSGNWEEVDQFADAEYTKVYGSAGANQSGGISVDQLHTVFTHADDLHYWDISAIGPASGQSSDIAAIKAALNAGYPVVATVVETSVHDLTGDIPAGNPYEWNPVCDTNSCPTHVIVWIGIAPDGNLLAWDYANVVGPLQGNNQVRQQPRKYDITTIDNQFATVVQVVGPNANTPWLKPIPSGDPTTWPAGFNGQSFTIPTPPENLKALAFAEEWASVVPGLDPNTGIAQLAYKDYWTGNFHGPAQSKEFQLHLGDGSVATAQVVNHGIYTWQNGNGAYHPYF